MADYYEFKDKNDLPIQEEPILVVSPARSSDELIIREFKNGEFVKGTQIEMEVEELGLENTELTADIHNKDIYISTDTSGKTMAAFQSHEIFTVECEGSIDAYEEAMKQVYDDEFDDEFDDELDD